MRHAHRHVRRIAAACGLAAAAGLVGGARVHALIEAVYSLEQFINESDVIVEGHVEEVDTRRKTGVIRVTDTLKGACAFERIRMNIGVGQSWHPDCLMKHLAVGAPVLVFYQARPGTQGMPCLVYLNRFFFQLFGDRSAHPSKAWWNFTHIEIKVNRTFNGPAPELIAQVREILAGTRRAQRPNTSLAPLDRAGLERMPPPGPQPESRERPARPRDVQGVRLAGGRPGRALDRKVLERWDTRLRELVGKTMRAAKRPAVHLTRRVKAHVVGLDGDGTLRFRAAGVHMSMAWTQISVAGRTDLALGVAEVDPAGHAVAAFYLHAVGNRARAESLARLARRDAAGQEQVQADLSELEYLFGTDVF